ncbi:AraC family transcriptional regulator [uncultured Desulfosarcina sp.]|uniref:helix-turn-helix domain-containing protein n=1 Tax=uncultured Desulfosarcina sp. TaxID=218289 RepID=UPI0029C6C852|nr:AraC family transcriptional regulator [uncultured Desulfosarcina sp.]
MADDQTSKTNPVVSSPLPLKDTRAILSQGSSWAYRIQDGFWVSRLDIESGKNLRLEYEKDQPALNFGFILSGNYINCFKAPGLNGKEFSNHAGTSGISYLSRQEGVLVIPAGTHVHLVHIHLSLPVFHDLFHMEENSVPRGLQPILNGPVERSYAFRAGMSPEVRSVLDRMVRGPLPGAPARLFYQGIALDLIAGQIARANSCLPNRKKMSCGDQDRVMHARDLLTQDLVSPPCLKELSRKVGINMNKLQQGFHRLYGVSVFKYLQHYRMQEANRLFHETDMNVSQAAAAVGYTNISHFSSAYKKHFNILPKKHILGIRDFLTVMPES